MNVYLSKHPTEKNSNDEFYRKIGLIMTYKNIPSELIISNSNINYIAKNTIHMTSLAFGVIENP